MTARSFVLVCLVGGCVASRAKPTPVAAPRSSEELAKDLVAALARECKARGECKDPRTVTLQKGPLAIDGTSARITVACDAQPCPLSCSLDSAPLRSCDATTSLTQLQPGPHHFEVRAEGYEGGLSVDWSVSSDKWRSVSVATSQLCGVTVDGTLLCKHEREDDFRKLEGSDFATVSLGTFNGCAIRKDRSLWCWGSRVGALGFHAEEDVLAPRRVEAGRFARVALGGSHACALRDDGALWCWGNNAWGAVGNARGKPGPKADVTVPTEIAAGTRWKAVALGEEHTCGIQLDGSLYCWGNNSYGAIGLAKDTPKTGETYPYARAPVKISNDNWISVGAGDRHSCAVRVDGTLWCWGNNSSGQTGVGFKQKKASEEEIRLDDLGDEVFLPKQVGTGADWTSVLAGSRRTCAVRADRSQWCWGEVDEGHSPGYGPTPVKVGDRGRWADFAAGNSLTCAIDESSALRCRAEGTNRHDLSW